MRTWGLSLVIAVAVAAGGCDSGEARTETSAAETTAPAGEVVELTGTARATRAGQTRDLAVGSDVFADDEIETTEGTELAVLLAHNNARWSLSGEQKRRVDKSAAWRAEKQTGTALASKDDDRTAAAGRHTEREAASTRETAVPGTAAPASKTEAPAATPESARASAAPPPAPPESTAKPKKRKKSSRSGTGRGGGGTGEGTIGLGKLGTIGKGGGGGSGSGYGRGAEKAREKRRAPRVRTGKATVSGSLDKEVIRRIVRRHKASLRGCYERELQKDPELKGKVTVSFTITAEGGVVGASATGMADAVTDCVAKRFGDMTFPKPKGGGIVKVKYPISFSPE